MLVLQVQGKSRNVRLTSEQLLRATVACITVKSAKQDMHLSLSSEGGHPMANSGKSLLDTCIRFRIQSEGGKQSASGVV